MQALSREEDAILPQTSDSELKEKIGRLALTEEKSNKEADGRDLLEETPGAQARVGRTDKLDTSR